MRGIVSAVLYWSSWLVPILTAVATSCWIYIVADGNYCWSAFAFTMVAVSLAGGTLVLGVVPCLVLYLKQKQGRDLQSLWLAAGSCVVFAVEAALLNILPMRGE